ncbi:MAG: acetate/propionate family kinase [Caulobacteraceae bacterium]|nr:acetate/propionate family kinase [Caulobacteraceae bacterium]
MVVVNAGSSSIKLGLYEASPPQTLLYRGQLAQIGLAPKLEVRDALGKVVADRRWASLDHKGAAQAVLETARELAKGIPVTGVGHRVVHGGMSYAAPIRVDSEALAALKQLSPLAPLHQPHNLAVIEAIADAAPAMAQVACFDTAFHRHQPATAQLFGIPRALTESGIRRYGFHGLSYEYVALRLRELDPELAAGRVVIAHLGAGASLCAAHGGRSVASTMGFTAADGLVMGTRCGALDPGVLLYLMDSQGMDARALEDLVYRRSGLLGVSGLSSDMRELRASRDPAAAEAIALFVYRAVRETGSMAAALGGLDGLVFTGGIGENDSLTRAEIARGCRWLGLELDEALNHRGMGKISAQSSRIAAWVIPTDEERMIASHTCALLTLAPG